jgi:hypothetical protein
MTDLIKCKVYRVIKDRVVKSLWDAEERLHRVEFGKIGVFARQTVMGIMIIREFRITTERMKMQCLLYLGMDLEPKEV